MMKYLLALFILISNSIYSQTLKKEFEGIVTYKTTIVLKKKGADVEYFYQEFGKVTRYYYKAGKFKWATDGNLEYEIYNPAISPLVLDKVRSADTLYGTDISRSPDTVTSVKKTKNLTILNIPCRSAIFTVSDGNNSRINLLRTIYYPTDTLQYAKTYWDHYKASGQGFIARYTNAIPLRMELASEVLPYSIIYEATKLEWKELADSEFLVDEKLPVSKVPAR
jgi:hypothetical protein